MRQFNRADGGGAPLTAKKYYSVKGIWVPSFDYIEQGNSNACLGQLYGLVGVTRIRHGVGNKVQSPTDNMYEITVPAIPAYLGKQVAEETTNGMIQFVMFDVVGRIIWKGATSMYGEALEFVLEGYYDLCK